MAGAVSTGKYRNLFAECGIPEEEINKRLEETFQTMFYGSEEERIYHPAGEDMGYMEDTGNHDVRTEGMSYGMMMCVQLNKKEEFDRLWKWAKTYMYLDSGWNQGYFAWSCRTDGTKNANGPAPDGEEFFAMSLFFASKRWGDGEGIFCYSEQARQLLSDCVHKGEEGKQGGPMWNPENKLIDFVVGCGYSDPSYHCPHFYELFAEYANEEDRQFWKEAAAASRAYLVKACHPVTGLSAEYAEYDGSPKVLSEKELKIFGSRHDWFYSDAYRTIANIALDYEWYGKSEELRAIADKIQRFFAETVKDRPEQTYLVDGTVLDQPALHPVGLFATNAQASLAAEGPYAKDFVMKFWNMPLRTGDRRYYDNCLYLFAMLALSGNYRAW